MSTANVTKEILLERNGVKTCDSYTYTEMGMDLDVTVKFVTSYSTFMN